MKTTGKQRGGVTGKGFLPGRSGNPGGRPSTKPLTDELKRRLRMRLPAATAKRLGLRSTATYAEGISAALIREALNADVMAARAIFDRIEGSVQQSLQLDATQTVISLENDAAVVEKLLGDAGARDGATALYAQLLTVVRTSDDEQTMRLATQLALKLKGGNDGNVA